MPKAIRIHVTEHTLTITEGCITLLDHPNVRAEIALLALGGSPCPCVAYALFLEYLSALQPDNTILSSLDEGTYNRTASVLADIGLSTRAQRPGFVLLIQPGVVIHRPLRIAEGTDR